MKIIYTFEEQFSIKYRFAELTDIKTKIML